MVNTVNHKRSAVAGKIPTTTDLELGQLAINTTDGKLFLKKSVGGSESIIDVGKDSETAVKLKTPRNIGGVSFDGTADITLPGVNAAGNQNTTGNAATATKLQTARTIGGVSFDGSANINLPGVNTAGTQNTSGNAATATTLATARTINGVSFNGSANIVIGADWANITNKPATYAPSAHTHGISEVTGLQGALDGKVSLTGDQSVEGVKTFSTALEVTGTSKAAGRFYGGTTDPSNTTRTNYDGKLHATGFGSGRFVMEYNATTESLDFNFV